MVTMFKNATVGVVSDVSGTRRPGYWSSGRLSESFMLLRSRCLADHRPGISTLVSRIRAREKRLFSHSTRDSFILRSPFLHLLDSTWWDSGKEATTFVLIGCPWDLFLDYWILTFCESMVLESSLCMFFGLQERCCTSPSLL